MSVSLHQRGGRSAATSFGVYLHLYFSVYENPQVKKGFNMLLVVLVGALLKFKFSKKTYLIVIKDETGLKFKMNGSTLFLIWSYAQKLVASY